jgi:deoxyribonuclease-4
MPIVGHTMALTTVTDSIRLINTMGGRAVQLSLGDPSTQHVVTILNSDADMTRKIREKHGFYVVIHGKFLYNFCRPPSSISWQHRMLCQELEQANKIGADVIIHQGKNLKELNQSEHAANKTFAENIHIVLDQTKHLSNCIILENSAKQGTECGYSLDSLHEIYTLIGPHPRIKFCIDLCHIFVAGELDVRNQDRVLDWFKRFDTLIGLSKLACIHFNDSNTDFHGCNDNHGSIGLGYIGKVSTDGFKYVCKLANTHQIPLILETSSEHIQTEINMLNEWSSS